MTAKARFNVQICDGGQTVGQVIGGCQVCDEHTGAALREEPRSADAAAEAAEAHHYCAFTGQLHGGSLHGAMVVRSILACGSTQRPSGRCVAPP